MDVTIMTRRRIGGTSVAEDGTEEIAEEIVTGADATGRDRAAAALQGRSRARHRAEGRGIARHPPLLAVVVARRRGRAVPGKMCRHRRRQALESGSKP
jgi:hypothetical protein